MTPTEPVSEARTPELVAPQSAVATDQRDAPRTEHEELVAEASTNAASDVQGIELLLERLDDLFDSSLADSPPGLAQMEAVVQELAARAVIDPDSIQRGPEGQVLSARLSIPGSELAGR